MREIFGLWIVVCYENHAKAIPKLEEVLTPECSSHDEPLLSIYANDSAVADILPLFVSNVPKYLGNLEAHIGNADWTMAARVCHDLKGTAGGYGYPDIGAVAKRLESEVKGARSLDILNGLLAEAKILCERARRALPDAESSAT